MWCYLPLLPGSHSQIKTVSSFSYDIFHSVLFLDTVFAWETILHLLSPIQLLSKPFHFPYFFTWLREAMLFSGLDSSIKLESLGSDKLCLILWILHGISQNTEILLKYIQMVSDLRWFDLQFFKFTVVWKWYTISRSYFKFWILISQPNNM